MKNILAISFLIFIPLQAADDGAYRFVVSLYENYKDDNSKFNFLNPKADTIFTPKLLALLRLDEKMAKGEVGVYDGDPICDCQDNSRFHLDTILITNRSDSVFALVKFNFIVDSMKVILHLQNRNGKWLIGDIEEKWTPSFKGFLIREIPKIYGCSLEIKH
jgi:hypothetical protein